MPGKASPLMLQRTSSATMAGRCTRLAYRDGQGDDRRLCWYNSDGARPHMSLLLPGEWSGRAVRWYLGLVVRGGGCSPLRCCCSTSVPPPGLKGGGRSRQAREILGPHLHQRNRPRHLAILEVIVRDNSHSTPPKCRTGNSRLLVTDRWHSCRASAQRDTGVALRGMFCRVARVFTVEKCRRCS